MDAIWAWAVHAAASSDAEAVASEIDWVQFVFELKIGLWVAGQQLVLAWQVVCNSRREQVVPLPDDSDSVKQVGHAACIAVSIRNVKKQLGRCTYCR